MQKANIKFKKGAASFYVVAFSTLILVVIAASFTTIVLSEMRKSENDELSQSAYDAALAGVEDAKVAFANYQKCLSGEAVTSSGISCESIKEIMKKQDCDMVAKILGRIGENENGEVLIEESSVTGGVANNMQQAYTCTMIKTTIDDYVSTLTETNPTKVVKVKLGNGVSSDSIDRVKISWYETNNAVSGSKYTFSNFNGERVAFPSMNDSSVPPMISVGLIQTQQNGFSLDDFTIAGDEKTNRGTVFLVPTSNEAWAKKSKQDNYMGIWNGERNVVSKDIMVKSNNRKVKNLPLGVYCKNAKDATEDFACSAWLELPKPIKGAARSDETFMLVVSLPYGKPSTSFSLEFYCAEGSNCGRDSAVGDKANLEGMQIEVDSTGRANNLYRRVLTRLEPTDTYFPFPIFAIELLSNDNGDAGVLTKPWPVIREWGI